MKKVSIGTLESIPTSHGGTGILKKVFIDEKTIPHITKISQATFKPGEIAPAHSHSDMYEIFYVERGSGIVKVDGNVEKLRRGDVIVLEPGDEHEFINTSKKNLVVYYFGVVE